MDDNWFSDSIKLVSPDDEDESPHSLLHLEQRESI